MKALSCLCVGFFATFLTASAASALNAPAAAVAVPKDANAIVKASYHHTRRGMFRNWCAYNCTLVSRFARPPLGRYGYSQFAYDEDLPIAPRWDRDASPVDNVLGAIHPYTGEYFIRAFERRW